MSEELIDIPLPGEPRNTLIIRLRRRNDAVDSFQARRIVPMALRKSPRNPYVTKSLGTTDLDTAKLLAIRWERSLFAKIDRGETLHPLPFYAVARKYLKDSWERSELVDTYGDPLVNKSNVSRDEAVIRRYLIPFFGQTDIREITQRSCERFLDWRMDYYVTGPGKDETEMSYMRGGKQLTRPVAKNVRPAPSTINKDAVAFNKIMRFARRQHDLPNVTDLKIKVPKVKSHKARRRPRFNDDELELLNETATERCIDAAGRNAHCRHMLWGFIELMLGTGIRVSEAVWLQAKHLEFRPISEERQKEWDTLPDTWDDDGVQAIKATAMPFEGDRILGFRIRIAKDNRGLKHPDHARLVIPAYYFSDVLFHHLAYLARHVSNLTGEPIDDPLTLPPDQFLFVNFDGSRTRSLRVGFRALMENSTSEQFPDGLLVKDGKTRSLTSLRHTYASKQIEAGATTNGLGFLADNMGTSTEMIRKHYAQVLHELRADDLQRY